MLALSSIEKLVGNHISKNDCNMLTRYSMGRIRDLKMKEVFANPQRPVFQTLSSIIHFQFTPSFVFASRQTKRTSNFEVRRNLLVYFHTKLIWQAHPFIFHDVWYFSVTESDSRPNWGFFLIGIGLHVCSRKPKATFRVCFVGMFCQ